ncbi:hypothetical protein [Halobacillus karajensis]|uniref:Uncharacterized protein n=1 Tax=Halobacillus karajensis TaxID=195088 RepID=A0A024P7S3_9BACI|nr:hypothetical protein [Halobacillus karajensis]CDQ20931.1 hypothetical protein BN982_03290 [Halobacillus karajensis]CDQ25005.1 hypothetical protein BN983_03307 [Halobacillus karajensis]CDQ28634.1 hypothetical protein BN981_02945 [Halobacillus karajensis]
MNRHLAFGIVLLFLLFSLPVSYGDHHSGYFKGDVQESTLIEYSPSTDDYSDKTAIISAFAGFILLISIVIQETSKSGRPFRKLFFLNPVFYQSNYVIQNL